MTKSVDYPFKEIVVAADPDFEREKRNEIEYEFRGKTFRANRSKRFPYDQDPQS